MKRPNQFRCINFLGLFFIFSMFQAVPTSLWAQSGATNKMDTSDMNPSLTKSSGTSSVFDWSSLNRVGMGAFAQKAKLTVTPGAIPVKKDYQLGPGDRLGIYLLGQAQREYNVTVNAEGMAYIPSVGVFEFQGHTLGSVKEKLRKEFYRYFAEENLEILLLEPKKVMVSVVGEVNKPGRYTLSGLQTTFDAVFAAGGPKPNGSLRNIRIMRTDSLIVNVDLYELLLKGKGYGGPSLQPGDIIKVLPLRSSVRIGGEVKRPGRYELDSNHRETLQEILDLSGGPTPIAYLERVEISRRLQNGRRKVRYVDARDTTKVNNPVLKDGDRVRIYSVLEQTHRRTIEILGQVRRPGVYTLEKNLTIRDLIQKAGGVKRSAYMLEAELDRIDPKKPVKREKFPLKNVLSGNNSVSDIKLEEFDRVLIRQIPEWMVGPSVEIKGEMKFPGRYTITKDSTTLSEVLELAGGFTEDALLREARLIRPSSRVKYDPEYERLKDMKREDMTDLEYEYLVMKQNQDVGQVVVDFYKLWIEKDESEDVILKDGDVIAVPKAPQVVEVTGRVSRPGGVIYHEGENLEYYLKKAGGVTWDARRSHTKVVKATGEILDDEDVNTLLPGDIIWVPRKPDRDYWQIFRDVMMVAGQLATIYLVIQNATR